MQTLSTRDSSAPRAHPDGPPFDWLDTSTPIPPARLAAIRVPAWDLRRHQRAEDACLGWHTAVGERVHLGTGFDWRFNPSRDPEWLIEHHKLPVLVDLALAWQAERQPRFLATWAALAGSWLAQMGTGELAVSDAQVEALRLTHGVQSLAILQATDGLGHLPDGLVPALVARIGAEARHVLANLRSSRNHRSFQLHAACLAAVALPALPGVAVWARQAHDGMADNLLTDIGPDGVQVELSTHYHHLVLALGLSWLALAEAGGQPVPPAVTDRLRQALRFSQWMVLPDGEQPLVNDADLDDARPLLAEGARRWNDPAFAWVASGGAGGRPPQVHSHWFEQAGYLLARDGWGQNPADLRRRQHLFADFGALGAGSHAHYDLFSFCYAIDGRQLVVDPGRYTYLAEPDADGIDWRHAFKCTAAHNTVEVDGRDQTRYLSKARQPAAGLARLDRRAHPSKHGPAVRLSGLALGLGRRSDWIQGTALSEEYRPRHSRLLVYVQRQYLLVVDGLDDPDPDPDASAGRGPAPTHTACWRVHLAADWLDRTRWQATAQGGICTGAGWSLLLHAPGADCRIERGWVSKRYGVREPAPVLSARQVWQGRTGYVAAILPTSKAGARPTLVVQAREDGGQSITVTGEDGQGAWTDRFERAAAGRITVHRADLSATGALVHERRRADGRLDHLLVTDTDPARCDGVARTTVRRGETLEC